MTEARLTRAEGGWLEPAGVEEWYVVNARDARWSSNEMGWYCSFEGTERFREFGLNLNRLGPGQPMAMYHHEPYQEGFLVLDGDALLIIEGKERPLRRWDYVHCPRDVPHVILGAGDNGALVLAVGSRVGPDGGSYPADEAAIRHGAGVEVATADPREAYTRFSRPEPSAYPADQDFLAP
jgi:uncharacterized cupin superfamily protein